MQSGLYAAELPGLVRSGRLKMEAVDRAVARVLRIKFALGLFERPYVDEKAGAMPEHGQSAAEYLDLALCAAEESFVLLKNESAGGRPLLPLAEGKTVALIGPLADDQAAMLGPWVMKADVKEVVTLRQALQERLQDRLHYAKGADTRGDSEAGFGEALEVAKHADVVLMALGEAPDMSGEAESRAHLDLPGKQFKLLQAVVATGKRVVLVLFSGRPLAISLGSGARAGDPGGLVSRRAGRPGPGADLVRRRKPLRPPHSKFSAKRRSGADLLQHVQHGPARARQGPLRHRLHRRAQHAVVSLRLGPFVHALRLLARADYDAASQRGGVGARRRDPRRSDSTQRRAAVRVRGRPALHSPPRHERRPAVRELKGFEKIALAPGESRTVRFSLTKKESRFGTSRCGTSSNRAN